MQQIDLEKIQFLTPEDKAEPADLIFVFGGNTLELPIKAAKLFHQGMAPKIIVNGHSGTFGNRDWVDPEAIVFKRKLIELAVPEDAIIVQANSKNTLEDVIFSKEYLANLKKVIIVAKPLHQLRALLTIKKQIPDLEYINQPCNFDAILDTESVKLSRFNEELSRLKVYSVKGDILKTIIPDKFS